MRTRIRGGQPGGKLHQLEAGRAGVVRSRRTARPVVMGHEGFHAETRIVGRLVEAHHQMSPAGELDRRMRNAPRTQPGRDEGAAVESFPEKGFEGGRAGDLRYGIHVSEYSTIRVLFRLPVLLAAEDAAIRPNPLLFLI